MNVVFFGSPAASLPTLKRLVASPHRVTLVVTQPDRPAGRGRAETACPVKSFALERGLPVYQPERIRKDPAALDRLREARPDVHVVVAFGQIMPGPVIYLPPFRSLNVHFSLLPKYRGAAPVPWAILNGDAVTGITVFELDEKMDEGPILARREVDIAPDEKSFELEARLAEVGANLLVETLEGLGRIRPEPQDAAAASYAPKIKKDDGRINWREPAEAVGRRVRAFAGWPSAFAYLGGKRIIIHAGRALPGTSGASGAPGTVARVAAEGIEVRCGDDSVFLVKSVQPENGRAMTAEAFARGHRVGAGVVFD
ncbi:MAG: methionyl-tRNA formyltransferase [Candidatus Aminicenantes bacterium]|nr:methionyl-tRNA formyltransferase [Candidatus Aminicenantes bacterium]